MRIVLLEEHFSDLVFLSLREKFLDLSEGRLAQQVRARDEARLQLAVSRHEEGLKIPFDLRKREYVRMSAEDLHRGTEASHGSGSLGAARRTGCP